MMRRTDFNHNDYAVDHEVCNKFSENLAVVMHADGLLLFNV